MKHTLEGVYSTREVWLNGKKLDPSYSQGLANHSPDGFNWGYTGSGPSQLSLAVLLELTDKEAALSNYVDFKDKHIATLPQDDFVYAFEFDLNIQSEMEI